MEEALLFVFVVSFFLNFLWEVWHSQLYTTCLSMRLPAYIRLITWQSVKDAMWITLAYFLAPNMYVFVGGLLIFAFLVEWHAVRTKRWQYATTMPTVFGVGLTPLLELAVTGLATLSILTLLQR